MRTLLIFIIILATPLSLTSCFTTSDSGRNQQANSNWQEVNAMLTTYKYEVEDWAKSYGTNLARFSKPILLEMAALKTGMDWPAGLANEAEALFAIYTVLNFELEKLIRHASLVKYYENKGNDNKKVFAANQIHFEKVTFYSGQLKENLPVYKKALLQHAVNVKNQLSLNRSDPRNGGIPSTSRASSQIPIVDSLDIGLSSLRKAYKIITPENLGKLSTTNLTTILPPE